eukprot:g44364.t1
MVDSVKFPGVMITNNLSWSTYTMVKKAEDCATASVGKSGNSCWDTTPGIARLRNAELWDEYFRMKLQWKSVTEDQERRNSQLRAYKSLIERDVSRTDRSNKFYEGNDNPGLVLLNDVLMTYCMYNFDLDAARPAELFQQLCFCYPLLDTVKSGFQDLLHFRAQQLTAMKRGHGYVQGMSDLLSPILYVTLNEVDSFWCFTDFMEQV